MHLSWRYFQEATEEGALPKPESNLEMMAAMGNSGRAGSQDAGSVSSQAQRSVGWHSSPPRIHMWPASGTAIPLSTVPVPGYHSPLAQNTLNFTSGPPCILVRIRLGVQSCADNLTQVPRSLYHPHKLPTGENPEGFNSSSISLLGSFA